MEEIADLEDKLAEIEREHKDLDRAVEELRMMPHVDFLQITRLQKKKLFLKDQMQKIRSEMLPDIIA